MKRLHILVKLFALSSNSSLSIFCNSFLFVSLQLSLPCHDSYCLNSFRLPFSSSLFLFLFPHPLPRILFHLFLIPQLLFFLNKLFALYFIASILSLTLFSSLFWYHLFSSLSLYFSHLFYSQYISHPTSIILLISSLLIYVS